MGEEKSVLLTQEAFDTLKDELAHRQGQYREEITKRIAQPAPRAICRRTAVTSRARGAGEERGPHQRAHRQAAQRHHRRSVPRPARSAMGRW